MQLCDAGLACASRAAPHAGFARRRAGAGRGAADHPGTHAPARRARFFRQPPHLDRDRRAAQYGDGQIIGARRRRSASLLPRKRGRKGQRRSRRPHGRKFATRPSRRATSARCRRRIFCFRAASSRSIRTSATMSARAFRPDAPSSTPRSNSSGASNPISSMRSAPPPSRPRRPCASRSAAASARISRHVMISGLRGIGLPAAYVSGYLRTVSLTDRPRLQGADAMHAWVMLWCGSGRRLDRARPDQCGARFRRACHARHRPRLYRCRADGRRHPRFRRPADRSVGERDPGRLIAPAITPSRIMSSRLCPAPPARQPSVPSLR